MTKLPFGGSWQSCIVLLYFRQAGKPQESLRSSWGLRDCASALLLRRFAAFRRFLLWFFLCSSSRSSGRIFHFAGHRLSFDVGDAAFLVNGHFLELGGVENEIEHLALDELGGQGVHHFITFELGTDAARRFVVL